MTILLQDAQSQPWPLSLSADCLRFIGQYRRVEGFDIDAILALGGLRKAG